MNKHDGTVEVAVEELKDARPTDDGESVVLDTTARVDGERHDTQIEVTLEDAPAVAVALMSPTPAGHPSEADEDDSLPPAMLCLAAGVIDGVRGADGVRLHLQFDSGQVLPVMMSVDAAAALARGLARHLDPARSADA